VKRFPLRDGPPVDRPYLLLADYFATAGDYAAARRMVKEFRDSVPAAQTDAAHWAERIESELDAREDRNRVKALTRLSQLVDSAECVECASAWLGRLYDDLGMSDSALARYEQRTADVGSSDRIWDDALILPRAYKRLGELYEAKGNRSGALTYYSKFVELWRNADPDLQPAVREVKQRMAQLAGEPR